MKELVFWLIIIFCALCVIGAIVDIIAGICKSHAWSILKNQISEYLKTIGEAKVIGFEENMIVESLIPIGPINESVLIQFSIDAKLCDRTFEWIFDKQKLIFKFSSI